MIFDYIWTNQTSWNLKTVMWGENPKTSRKKVCFWLSKTNYSNPKAYIFEYFLCLRLWLALYFPLPISIFLCFRKACSSPLPFVTLLSPIKEFRCLIIQGHFLQTDMELQVFCNNIHSGLTSAHDKLV